MVTPSNDMNIGKGIQTLKVKFVTFMEYVLMFGFLPSTLCLGNSLILHAVVVCSFSSPYNIPFYEYTTIYLSILLLMDI